MRLRKLFPLGENTEDEEAEESPEETERKRKKIMAESEKKPFSADVGRKVGLLHYRRKKQMIEELDED